MKRLSLVIVAVAASLAIGIAHAPTVRAATPAAILVKLIPGSHLPPELGEGSLARDLNIIRLPVPATASTASYLQFVRSFSIVAWAEPDADLRLTTTPNDPRFTEQTGMAQVQSLNGWNETTGSSAVTVAIIDTGIDGQHEDLTGRVGAGYNFVADQALTAGASSDDNGHGTSVAGIIGATGNNGKGIAGLNWAAQLMPLKVADADGSATASRVASAITYAADHGARVINFSLGTNTDFQSVRDAVTYASSKNVVMVAAAGNDSGGPVLYPAAYPAVVAVGSLTSQDTRSSFSNSGPELDLMAPGEAVLTTGLSPSHSQYVSPSGTSLAAPFVTGAASLVFSRYPSATAHDVINDLESQADKVAGMNGQTFTNDYGYGRVDLGRVLSYHARFVGQNAYPNLVAGGSYPFRVQLQNTGLATWQQRTVDLATDRAADRIPFLIREDKVTSQPSGWLKANRISLVETSVPPGGVGTFQFYYTVPATTAPGVYREYFRPVADGLGVMEDMGIYWDVTVLALAQTYHASFVSQNAYPTLAAGEAQLFEVHLKNTGIAPWRQGEVNLATDRDQDRIPQFIREDQVSHQPSGWLSSNRIQLVESSVPPGETGTFRFYYTVPANLPAGIYSEYFRPVADQITWLEDMGIYWDVTVLSPLQTYTAQFASQNAYPTLSHGGSYQFEVRLKNTGHATWTPSTVMLATDQTLDRIPRFLREDDVGQQPSGWLTSSRVQLVQSSVAPGATGTFRLYYTVPATLPAGVYREYFRPVAGSLGPMPGLGIFWDVTVLAN